MPRRWGARHYDLPPSEAKSFLLFHDFITNPQPEFITKWRSDPKEEKRYIALVEGLNGATRNAYACVLYHFNRLSALEAEVMERISKRDYANVLGNSGVGIGGTLKWDFEYHAFVFAYRRCLDYLTRGLASFFKQDFHSFKKMQKSLAKLKPENVASALAKVHEKHYRNFGFVMSDFEKKTVRDQIAHYFWVQAGTLNLSKNGFVMVGGGEELGPFGDNSYVRLTDALKVRVQNLKACIDEMLETFVTEARLWDQSQQ